MDGNKNQSACNLPCSPALSLYSFLPASPCALPSSPPLSNVAAPARCQKSRCQHWRGVEKGRRQKRITPKMLARGEERKLREQRLCIILEVKKLRQNWLQTNPQVKGDLPKKNHLHSQNFKHFEFNFHIRYPRGPRLPKNNCELQ